MYDRIKGFRDFYPEEMGARRQVIDTVEGTARRYGFREVGTPALEPAAMYADKSGEEILEEPVPSGGPLDGVHDLSPGPHLLGIEVTKALDAVVHVPRFGEGAFESFCRPPRRGSRAASLP